jgi:hypothetical protein
MEFTYESVSLWRRAGDEPLAAELGSDWPEARQRTAQILPDAGQRKAGAGGATSMVSGSDAPIFGGFWYNRGSRIGPWPGPLSFVARAQTRRL